MREQTAGLTLLVEFVRSKVSSSKPETLVIDDSHHLQIPTAPSRYREELKFLRELKLSICPSAREGHVVLSGGTCRRNGLSAVCL